LNWTALEVDGELQYRATLEGYLVYLRCVDPEARGRKSKSRDAGGWTVTFLIPPDERQRAYLAGEGFSAPTTLERAQEIAERKANELRAKLERKRG
jgi:hypothetical protein